MSTIRTPRRLRAQGFSMIEVLVTVLVLVIGLIGLFGLQGRATVVEMEAYQRAQALALLKDMEARIRSSRTQFDNTFVQDYASTQAPFVFGTDAKPDCAAPTGAMREMCQWHEALLGAAERVAGERVGAMIGARGCVMAQDAPINNAVREYFVVVVWQGLLVTRDADADAITVACADAIDYGDGRRRALSSRVLVPRLDS